MKSRAGLTREEIVERCNGDSPAFRAEEIERCRTDLTYFGSNYVYTLDQHNPDAPIRLLPQPEDLPHIAALDHFMTTERRLLIVKSRQMQVSINLAKYALWQALFHPGRSVVFQSDVLMKGGFGGAGAGDQHGTWDALLGKADFMYQHVQKFAKFLGHPHKISKQPPRLTFSHKLDGFDVPSTIAAVSGASSTTAGFTITDMICDEIGLQEHAQESFGVIVPTLSTTGRYVAAGTVWSKGFMFKTAFDLEKDSQEPEVEWVTPPYSIMDKKVMVKVGAVEVIPGMWMWKNPRNRFTVILLHYSADPHKRAAWADSQFDPTHASEFAMHYEIDWNASVGGSPVCNNWTSDNIKPVEYDPAYPVHRWFDYGTTPGMTWFQIVNDQVRLLKAVIGNDMQAEDLGERIVVESREYVDASGNPAEFLNGGDIKGRDKGDKSRRTSEQIVLEALKDEARDLGRDPKKVHIDAVRVGRHDKANLVNSKIGQRLADGSPGFVVAPSATTAIDMFSGRYRNDSDGVPSKDDKYEHIFDPIGYFIARHWPYAEKIRSWRSDEHKTENPYAGKTVQQLWWIAKKQEVAEGERKAKNAVVRNVV